MFDIGKPIYEKAIQDFSKQINTIKDFSRKKEFREALNSFKYSEEFVKSVHLNVATDEDRINRFAKVLVEDHSYKHWTGANAQSFEDKCVPVNEAKFITNQNMLQLRQCVRQVFVKPSDCNIYLNLINEDSDQ